MNIKPGKYVNKPFEILAIRVTEENIQEVSDWCKGTVIVDDGGPYIKVAVRRPLNVKQTMAHVGDWVLMTGRGPKVYTDIAFEKGYDAVKEPFQGSISDEEILDGIEEALAVRAMVTLGEVFKKEESSLARDDRFA